LVSHHIPERRKMDILDYIPTGSKNAIKRKYLVQMTVMSDRKVRQEIHKARRKIPILNLQDGLGYAIPDMNDAQDRKLLIRFVRQEESRLKSIGWALRSARRTLKNCGINWQEWRKLA